MTSIHSLQKKIMRRVWYSYVIQRATHPVAVHGAILAVAILLLARFVHVLAIWQNVSNVRVGDLLPYLASALTGTEWINLLLLGVIIMTILSLRFRLPPVRPRHQRLAQ